MTHTKIYRTWVSMRERCLSKTDKFKNNQKYKNYLLRGITICDRWNKFENFYKDMGDPPNKAHSLDRIDNNGNYSPENCRWATQSEQANNKRNNRYLTYNSKTQTVANWSKELAIPIARLRSRMLKKWDIEKVLSTKFRP